MVYTASDGTEFEDRNEWRKYEFETNYTFKSRVGETLLKIPGNISGQPFDLADLNECTVMLLDHSDQIQVDNLTNCRVFIGPSSESIFIRNCSNCLFVVACKQLRTRDCATCDFYLYSQTDPIIETSQGMRFAPFNGAYNGLLQHFNSARLDPQNNHWAQVYDFNDPDKSGKNWSLISPDEEMEPWVIPLDNYVPDVSSLGPCENPVTRDAKPSYPDDIPQDGSTMQSFGFETSQEEASNKLMQQENLGQPMEDPFGAPEVPVSTFSSAAPPAPMDEVTVESWPKLEEFQRDFAIQIEEKAAKEDVLIKETKSKAEVDLDKYYEQRTDRLAHRAATNREQEEEKLKTQSMLKEKACDQPWTRVVDLVDTNTSKKSSKTDKDKAGESSSDFNDTSRMRSILLQLKNSGGLEERQE